MISQFVRGDHTTWDQHLIEFRFAMNSSIHDSTKYSPAMLNFGRELKMPRAIHGPLCIGSEHPEETPVESQYSDAEKRMANLYRTVKGNLEVAYKQQAKYCNLRRRVSPFKIGQRVLKRQHILSSALNAVASKLAPKFDGPYTISDKVGANIYTLSDSRGKEIGRVHAKDLKPYFA